MAGIRAARETYLAENSIAGFKSKEDLARDETEFCILAEPEYTTDGQYGPAWKLAIVFLDEDGQPTEQTLFLSAGSTNAKTGKYKENAYRRWLLTQSITAYPAHFIKIVEGRNATGQKFYDLDDVDGAIEPCPCHTPAPEKRNGKHKIVQEAAEELVFKAEEESPIVDDLEGYRAYVSSLATQSGWPVAMTKLMKMSKEQLKDLEKTIKKFGE